jgi:dihydrodipicolinate synthase/N-acetylneuraminate lyase
MISPGVPTGLELNAAPVKSSPMTAFNDLDKWKGVFPAVPTAFNDDSSINEAGCRAILEDNISHGVHGFWNCGGTGEGAILTDQQRTTMARIVGETCKGRVLSIMHVGSPTTESSVKAARAARESGCDAICCVPPAVYVPNDNSIVEHYQRVADAAGLPFFAYNLPQMVQVEILPPLMERLMREVPQLVGLKHSAFNFSNLCIFASMGLKAFTGNGYLLLPALAAGGIGVVDAPPSVAPWTYVEMFNAWQSGDLDTAMARQRETRAISVLTKSNGTPHHNTKLIIGARTGMDLGEPLRPLNRLDADQQRTLLEKADQLGLISGPG